MGGVIAALLTSRGSSGALDLESFERNARFVIEAGAAGVCVFGATGEYPLMGAGERQELLACVARLRPAGRLLVAGAGGASLSDCVVLARQAAEAGADAILLPPPHFFRYSQDDLEQFYREAARRIAHPVLIYNLPSFTNPVEVATAVRLIETVPSIVGIKDSGGGLEMLRELARRDGLACRRLVGHDAVLAEALREGLCHGVISGVAGVLPELTLAVYRGTGAAARALDELLDALEPFPAPWGLKLVARCRGFFEPTFPLPLAESRQAQIRTFDEWFAAWWPAVSRELTML